MVDEQLRMVFAQKIQRLIHHYPREPGLQRALALIFKRMNFREDADECLLQYIVHIFDVGDIACANSRQIIGIFAIELVHGECVALLKKTQEMLFFVISEKIHSRQKGAELVALGSGSVFESYAFDTRKRFPFQR